MMNIFNSEYLSSQPLDESLLLSVGYDPKVQELTLVYDYAAEVVSNYFEFRQSSNPQDKFSALPRDFRKILFTEVSNYYIFDTHNRYELHSDELQKRIDSASITVWEVDLSKSNQENAWNIKLITCNNLFFEFQYNQATVERKRARGVSRGDDWDYYDLENNEEINFYRPFE